MVICHTALTNSKRGAAPDLFRDYDVIDSVVGYVINLYGVEMPCVNIYVEITGLHQLHFLFL